MKKRILPYALMALALVMMALLLPSATGVRIEPARLTPTPEMTNRPTATPTPAPTETPVPVPEEYVLRSMSDSREYHEDVEWIQARLSKLGFYSGKADGYYGRSTFEAVYNFQRMNGLETDGMAGAATQQLLFESDTVKNALGNVYTPFVAPTFAPTPTPSPTPRSIPMDSFQSGSKPNENWFGGNVYRDSTIDVSVEKDAAATVVKVRISAPYQLRSALAGSYELPQSLDLETLSRLNNAVVAFAGSDYTLSNDYELRQQLVLKDDVSADKALLVIDTEGKMRLYTPAAAPTAVQELGARMLQALTVPKALVISGITRANLSEKADGCVLAFGQTGELSYVLVYGELSERALAERMIALGCDNAAIVGMGGVYTCFGDETRFSYEKDGNVSNILYFASHIGEAR